jgi:hypothetical protein
MLLVAGYFRLGDELPKPVWTYPVSYLSFYTYAIQVFLELIFVCVFHRMDIIYLGFCQLTPHIVSNLHEELIEGRG